MQFTYLISVVTVTNLSTYIEHFLINNSLTFNSQVLTDSEEFYLPIYLVEAKNGRKTGTKYIIYLLN